MAGVAAVVCACRRPSPAPETQAASTRAALVERAGLAMGSGLRLSAWTADPAAAQSAFDAVFREFDRLDALMSVWKADSDVLRVNAAAGERAVAVDRDVRDVLRIAQQVSDWTGGRFDVTFGPLADLWKFDQDQDDSIPSADAIRRRLPLVDYRQIQIDETAGTVMLKRKGMRIHLGGIGKGYAVDHAVKIFRDRGLRDFMIQAGGDMYAGGRHGDRPWKLGIADPRGEHTPFATVELSDATFSTSGDYERFFVKDGVRYHHILDLSAGQPARLCRSVTLVTDRAVIADALAKGVFILGPEAGMALIERLPGVAGVGVAGVIVGANNNVLVSAALKSRFVLVASPTEAP
ncbi:MAG: FAD:protein FMN transferase [Acidobacteria bacterium]|nr:FAD:protein FMN transferase [Acidobacteriota bacterium]